MACYHPLFALPERNPRSNQVYLTENGKPRLRVFSPSVNIDLDDPELIRLPCGRCIGCRLEYSRQWANRCLLELEYHKEACFITLTYDDDHIPISWYSDPATGEAMPALSLRKRDFQLFMKRLRKALGDVQIRFFAAGEYGKLTFRPHFHAIIFGWKPKDLVYYRTSETGYTYYNSPFLDEVWTGPLNEFGQMAYSKGSITPLSSRSKNGMVVVADCTWETCAYVARYTAKKSNTYGPSYFESFNIEPPFSLMSRKPGLGRQWYDDHPDVYDYEYINLSTKDGGKKFKPPKYYDKLFDIENPEKSAEIKAIRKHLAEEATKAKLENTSLSFMELLEVEEHSKEDKIKKLKRSL
uniref:Replication initiator protein n=1 Tax=Dulem virus 113 TaxID=3145590 RepID=A0AAU8B8D0_9VIRU